MLTHLHSDHIGGLLNGDQPRFRHATIYVHHDEINYWLSDERLAQASDAQRRALQTVRKLLIPYQKHGDWVAGAHLSFPGIGHIQALGDGSYRWLPINYRIPEAAHADAKAAE